MEILVDGRSSTATFARSATVADAFETIRQQVHERGRIIAEVRLDEDEIVWGDGSDVWSWPIADVKLLAFQTDEPLRMVQSLLDQLIQRLDETTREHRRAAQMLRQDQLESAIEYVLRIIPFWEDLMAGYQGLQSLLQMAGKPPPPQIEDQIEILTRQLTEFRSSADVRDFVLMADLLDYELAPLAQTCKETCQQLADRIRLDSQGHGGASCEPFASDSNDVSSPL